MELPNIKESQTVNGYTAYEDWDVALLLKLLSSDTLLRKTTVKNKHTAVISNYENEWTQMCEVLRKLFIKEPKNLTFNKRQLYYFSQHLELFKPSLKVLYTFCEGKNIGRVYPVGSLGFTNTRKQIRHTFCRGKWVDIDISNAHPNLLNQMYQGRHRVLNDYCNHRASYFDKLKQHFQVGEQQYLTDNDACKSYFIICVLYNGGWDSWCSTNGLPSGVPVPDFHNELMLEMDSIYQDLLTRYSELANDLFQNKDWNLQGTLVSWVLQDEERKCLEAMVEYATKEKLISKAKKDRRVVLAYDGLQLIKNPKINTVFLRKMEAFILEHTGYDLKLAFKEFNDGYTAEELNFEIQEPPELEDTVFDSVEILGEFLDLPENEEEQVALCNPILDLFMECLISRSDVDIAIAIKALHQNKMAFVGDKTWYLFTNCWMKDDYDMVRGVISGRTFEVFKKILNILTEMDCPDEEIAEQNAKRIKGCSLVMADLKSCGAKTNIYKELKEVCLNPEFAKDFNLAKDVIPIKGGLLLNMVDNTVRERTIEDKFDYECDVDLLTDHLNGEAYLKSIFVNDDETLQVFCNVIKSCMSGRNLRKLFICSGSGRNGKSLLFKKLSKAFGKGMDTLSKSLFVETKQTSALNTEYEKLDKIRVGFNGEIEDDDKLNQSGIKKISGGDSINLRTLHTKDYTIFPTANLFLCVNNLPNFSKEQAVIDRLVNFPFNGKFPEDASYEAKVDGWLSEIFSYIMLKGELIDVVEPSPAMIIQKQEHIQEQADSIAEFIVDRIVRLEPLLDEKPYKDYSITNRDFYNAYVDWCHQNNQKPNSIQVVGKNIKQHKIEKKESNGKTWYLNIKIADFAKPDEF